MEIDIALTPALLAQPEDIVAVVIDVLRATSSVAALLGRGVPAVPAVYLAPSPVEAVALRATLGDALLCGEVGGIAPEDFDYGNSPAEFASMAMPSPPPAVVLSTTNGTGALLAARAAPVAFAGALLNGGAVVAAALREARERGLGVTFVCAGTEGGARFCLEDAYVAGALAARLLVEAERAGVETARTDAVEAALAIGRAYGWKAGQALRESAHGRFLAGIGFADDIVFCAQNDRFEVAPRLVAGDGPPRLVAG